MHVDPDLQPECPQCGCEVLFDVQVDGVLVQSEDGLSVRFLVREGRTQVMRAVPLLEEDLDIDCSQCGYSGFLGDVLEEFGRQPPTTRHHRPSTSARPDLQPICPRCECEGMFEILVSGCSSKPPTGLSFDTPHGPAGISSTAAALCWTATMRSIAPTAATAPS